jgi:glycosyltransferase involved in cell wall biosynthesis
MVVDLSDVLFYLRHHDTLSGIQRVQLGLAQALIDTPAPLPHELIFVTSNAAGTRYLELAEADILALVDLLSAATVSHEAIKRTVAGAERFSPDYEPQSGDVFLLLGAFWVMENVFAQVAELKRSGVFVAILIHDIIPITHPEFCDKALTDSFNLFFNSVIITADLVMTVSDYTGEAVRRLLLERGISVPLATLREAHRTWTPRQHDAAASAEARPLVANPRYVCYVSTIEVRKNHLYLFQIWKQLIAELGDATPTLVFVGRPGWRVRDFMDQLESTEFLDGRIQILNGLSDIELASLYRNCLFTVFPSFVEGWGLPVGESLMFGRPCVASGTTSVPEVGGAFVDYVDPLSVPDGYRKIKRLIVDDDYREARTAQIGSQFVCRSWEDVAADLIAILDQHVPTRSGVARPVPPPLLQPGLYPFGHGNAMSRFVRSGLAAQALLMCDANWYGVEDFGRWMRGQHGVVMFRVPYDKSERIRIVVVLDTPSWFSNKVRITCNAACRTDVVLKPGGTTPVEFRTECDDGAIRLAFEVLDEIAIDDEDSRALSIGLRSIAFAGDADLEARIHILEGLMGIE